MFSKIPFSPDKHASRAIEEASAQKSAEFAVQRAAELELYLNQVIQHPCIINSQVLRLFLSLQDDLGTAWPEVSSNALSKYTYHTVYRLIAVCYQTGIISLVVLLIYFLLYCALNLFFLSGFYPNKL